MSRQIGRLSASPGAAACVAIALLTMIVAASHADNNCAANVAAEGFYTEGWGFDLANQRYQSRTSIDAHNVEQLALKWTFALDGGMSPHSYPLVSRDTVFVGTQSGRLQALDRVSGCVRWTYDASSEIRTAVTHGTLPGEAGGETYLFVGTADGRTHAVKARTGEARWVTDVRDHSMAMLTGSSLYHEGRLYVPVSSSEVVMAILPWYGCCTFRGSLVALDAESGEMLWRTHTVSERPQVTGSHYFFVQRHGPSGAPVWSAPTLDPARGLIYIGTGENYSSPASTMSDSIVALDLESGAVRWAQQYTSDDAFNVACGVQGHPNCPEENGPDLDFGAPPILTHAPDGGAILLAGQKSGGVYALRPDTGERIWERYFGRGGLLGGVHWGMAVNADAGLLFAPINDMQLFYAISEGTSAPGLYALDILTGESRWQTSIEGTCDDREQCHPGLSAAIVATPDLVFAGALDGFIRAYAADTGAVVWRFDTSRDFDATDGSLAVGGTLDVHGPMIAGDMMFILSGYARQSLRGGNALLAFQLKEPG
ncbi:MAG: PQQ-binding-like beta-propeller repeat protein [Pseudomonadales bacterium]